MNFDTFMGLLLGAVLAVLLGGSGYLLYQEIRHPCIRWQQYACDEDRCVRHALVGKVVVCVERRHFTVCEACVEKKP